MDPHPASSAASAQLSESRRAVLQHLKLNQPTTIEFLAKSLDLSYETARHHTVHLESAGWIARTPRTEGQVGRPESTYRLTEAGEHLFTKAYDQLALAVLGAVESTQGAAALRGVLTHIADAKVEALRPRIEGAPLAERLRILKDIYLPDDPFTRVIESDDGPILEERNCPFLSVALERPALCSLTVSVLSRLLAYRVKRECSFQKGDGCCRFRVQLDRPVAPEFRFAFEGEPE
jgi:predicted ArsR family transcriptional regulator